MISTEKHPERDTVLFDGECRFCQRQIAILSNLDLRNRFIYKSLHDPSVAADFPELTIEQLQEQMFVIDTQGNARGGATAVRYLSRKLPLLWPLALLLHIPGSLPLWNRLYKFIAERRLWIAGRCDTTSCQINKK